MDKKSLSESDICDKFIRPAMERASWHPLDQIYREFPLRAGRVVVRGKTARRDTSTVLRADYALFYKPYIPLAVVAAKAKRHAAGAGTCAACAPTCVSAWPPSNPPKHHLAEVLVENAV